MIKKPTNILKIGILSETSILFTLQSFRLRVFICKDVCQQANILGRKIVVHSGLEPATFGFQA